MVEKGNLKRKIIFTILIILLAVFAGLSIFNKFYHVKIILPIDTSQEAIEVVKQNRVLIEEDLKLNNKTINIILAKYSKIGSIYDTAYSVMVYKNAPGFLFWVTSCPEYIYVHVDKMDAKVKYIEFTTCSGKPLCKNFKCIVWNEIPPDELYNASFCESLNNENLKDICSKERQKYLEKGIIQINQA